MFDVQRSITVVTFSAALTVASALIAEPAAGQSAKKREAAKRVSPTVAVSPTDGAQSNARYDDLSKRLTPQEMKAAMLIECVQPNYDAWNSVTIGTPIAKVREILGEPLEDLPPPVVFGPNAKGIGRMTYGRIWFESPSMPQEFQFTISTTDGKAYTKEAPFCAALSKSRKPSVPVLIGPTDGAKFDHYPRFIDFRWYPSSGEYPIWYEVEVASGLRTVEEDPKTKSVRWIVKYYDIVEIVPTKIPYLAWSFVGSSPGRWRVKAKNRHGESAWTQWRTFDFSELATTAK